jgi:hypothetical protein
MVLKCGKVFSPDKPGRALLTGMLQIPNFTSAMLHLLPFPEDFFTPSDPHVPRL